MGDDGSVVRRKHSRVWVMPKRGRVEFRAWGRSYRCADLVIVGQRMGGDGSFVRRKKSGEWAEVELFLYEGNEAFVRCSRRRLSRLSENTL